MDILNITGVAIEGIVATLPENLLDNKQAMEPLYGNGVETLIKATGIEARATANCGTTTLDLCVAAAKQLLDKTGTLPEEIGAVICVTFTQEYKMPADAPSAQYRLGLPSGVLAFDISMACSGYGYGLYIAAMVAKSTGKKVLLLDGDVQSAFTSQEDKATVPVLADIGTATLLAPSQSAKEWHFAFLTDGSRRDVLYIPAGGAKQPTREENLVYREYADGSKRRDIDIYMDGFEVFKFVAMDASRFLKSFLTECGESVEGLDAFVPHQANIYMIGQLAKKLKISKDKMWVSGDKYGNPGSASVPLTIAKNGKDWFEGGKMADKVLFAGFGGGLSLSTGIIELDKNAVYEVIQY